MHDAERGRRQRLTEDLLLTYRHGFIAGSACRVKVGILISELRVEACKPQVNIHPCVIAKWITFTTPLYCNLAKDYYPPNTCTYNLFNLATRRADKAVWWSGAIAINVIKQRGEIYIKHLSSDEREHGPVSLGGKKNPVWHFDVNDDLVRTMLIHLLRYQSF